MRRSCASALSNALFLLRLHVRFGRPSDEPPTTAKKASILVFAGIEAFSCEMGVESYLPCRIPELVTEIGALPHDNSALSAPPLDFCRIRLVLLGYGLQCSRHICADLLGDTVIYFGGLVQPDAVIGNRRCSIKVKPD